MPKVNVRLICKVYMNIKFLHENVSWQKLLWRKNRMKKNKPEEISSMEIKYKVFLFIFLKIEILQKRTIEADTHTQRKKLFPKTFRLHLTKKIFFDYGHLPTPTYIHIHTILGVLYSEMNVWISIRI